MPALCIVLLWKTVSFITLQGCWMALNVHSNMAKEFVLRATADRVRLLCFCMQPVVRLPDPFFDI